MAGEIDAHIPLCNQKIAENSIRDICKMEIDILQPWRMIKSFAHKGLKRLYDNGDRSKLPADMVPRIEVLLAALDEADMVADLDRPSFRVHQLKGDLKGLWSITVRANWRIVFRLEDGHAFDVDFMDYH
jgi:proteic killer suppression protein